MAEPHGATPAPGTEPSTGELISRLSEQSALLVRYELQLAQAEMTAKAKRFGLGAGLFGTAGLIALYGLGALIATVILALALVVDPWLAALIVTVVLFLIAAIAGWVGKKQVDQAVPVAPEQTIESVKQDVETIKEARR